MSNELRDYHCHNCGSLIGQIRVGSRIKTGVIMLCRACQEYDVPGTGKYRAESGMRGTPGIDWLKKQFGMGD